jgi:hypothetical protein
MQAKRGTILHDSRLIFNAFHFAFKLIYIQLFEPALVIAPESVAPSSGARCDTSPEPHIQSSCYKTHCELQVRWTFDHEYTAQQKPDKLPMEINSCFA